MDSLSEQQSDFVEEVGLWYEDYGQRSLGKIFGVLLITDAPLSQEDLMRLLNLSRSSVSTGLRWAERFDLVEPVSIPGERKKYYQITPDLIDMIVSALSRRIEHAIELFTKAMEVAEPGARQRLSEARDFEIFLRERVREVFAEWEKKQPAQ